MMTANTQIQTNKRSWPRRIGFGLLALLLVGGLAACGSNSTDVATSQATPDAIEAPAETTLPHEPETFEFVVPPGTSKKLALRQEVEILPDWLDVRVGDRIQVRNDDNEMIRLGIFDVRPGETISMTFNTVGRSTNVVYSDESGGCGVPPPNAKTFTVDVQP